MRLLRADLLDAAKTFMECGMTPEKSESGGVHRPGLAIDLEFHHMPHAAEVEALERLGKYGLRIQSGDEALRADDMRDTPGGDTNGAIGSEMDAETCERCRHQDDGGDEDPLPDGHAVLQLSAARTALLARCLRRAN